MPTTARIVTAAQSTESRSGASIYIPKANGVNRVSKLYPAISHYPGAKAGYVGQVIAEILPYDGINQYYEVFGGMANILLHKRPHPQEYYNDLNKKLATLMFVLSDEKLSKDLFELMLDTTDYYDQSSFDYAKFASQYMLDPESEFMREYAQNSNLNLNLTTVEKAAEVWRTLLMSINGAMSHFKGIRVGNEALTLEYQLQKKLEIPERLRNVNILNEDAFELIEVVKPCSDALMVCDSPYTKKQMGSKVIYECEFSEQDQYRYIRLVQDSTAKVLVCGYDNEIYNSILLDSNSPYKWYKYEVAEVSKSMAVTAIDGSKSKATEMIWTNWPVLKN